MMPLKQAVLSGQFLDGHIMDNETVKRESAPPCGASGQRLDETDD